ncbi:glycosyltransferase family 4 protein [Rhodocyclus tenuis]|uniref:Glycosyltransferase involved in cell wall biosynthesis n=1 Tax=Rhodocyclus tenuis TaxID=1066 RepID=A0A840G2Z7_RHOTE|nr:glycosyltransferase [Rhodocyclus tenuis]MBB4246305.1 glycosyltransferase involved in cell wall biosynthesis [Rhodocyclus tenuis]
MDYLRSAESINSSDVVLLYGRGWSRLEPVVRLCRERGARVFLDSVEILDRFDGFGGCASPIWWDWRLGTQRLPALVDGVTAISRPIEAWNISRGARRTLILPAIESWGCPPRSYPAECDKPFFVAYLGALTTKDDPETMLAAMRLLAEENVPVRLKIAGAYAKTAGGKRYIAKVNADPVLREVVIFSGYLADGERESWLASSDALILLRSDSLAEKHSFPTRLPESLRTGLPVITSDVGDMAWHLRDGVDAAVVPPGNPRALAAVLRGLAAKDDRGREMGLSGWFRGAERFDRRRHARAFLDFVDDCS